MKSPHHPVVESFFYSFKRQVSNMARLKLSVIIQPFISGFLEAEAFRPNACQNPWPHSCSEILG